MFVSEVEFMLHKKQLNRIIKIQELKLKLLEKEIKINKIDTRIQLTAMAAILKPSEMSDTDFVLKINEKMSELWSEEALIRQDAKINQELLEIQKTLNFFNESCQALGILVDLNKKRLATCKKCGKTNKECFPTTIEEYDMYIEMLCENCLTEILDKKITAIKP